MAAEDELYTALSGASAVTDITGDRLYSDVRDQEDDVPCVFWVRSSTEVINTIHGGAPISEVTNLVVVCFESTRELAETLGDAVQTAAINAGFIYSGRSGEYNPDVDVYATIFQFTHNEV